MNDSKPVPPRDTAPLRLQTAIPNHAIDEGDEPPTTWTAQATFTAVIDRRYSRRQVMRGGLQAAMAGIFASVAPIGCALPAPHAVGGRITSPRAALGFKPIPIYDGDEIVVAPGYTGRPFLVTGTPTSGPDVGNPKAASVAAYEACSGADMEQRIGAHHDGMHYFPFPDDPNNHGLLCMNHEYIDGAKMVPEKAWVATGRRPADQVRKGVASHGVSVTEIRRQPGGEWQVVPGRYNKRITAETSMEIRGAVRGSPLVVTKYSPDGTRARGTFNNCANGTRRGTPTSRARRTGPATLPPACRSPSLPLAAERPQEPARAQAARPAVGAQVQPAVRPNAAQPQRPATYRTRMPRPRRRRGRRFAVSCGATALAHEAFAMDGTWPTVSRRGRPTTPIRIAGSTWR